MARSKKTQVALEPEGGVVYVDPDVAAAQAGDPIAFTVEILE